MAPSTKKRKEPLPNCTLTDFFSGADATKRARVKQPRQLSLTSVRQTRTRMASREVIVIESDSDDSTCGTKKEIICVDSRTAASEDSTTGCSDKDIFGVPSELLFPTTQRVGGSSNTSHVPRQQSPATLEPDQLAKSVFGKSAPLLEEACAELDEFCQSKVVAQENTSTVTEGDSPDDAVGFSIGEWSVADDELLTPQALDGSTNEGEPFNEYFCPVCGMDLTGIQLLESQTHVNQCLDMVSQDDNISLQGCPSGAVQTKPHATSDCSSSGTLVKSRGNDLYTILMNSHRDKEIWVEADATADRESRSTRGNRRRAPFYKVLQGMPIAVDAFCYGTIPGVTAYFLTHAHSDHYTNLGSKWNNGPIYCSEETSNLIKHMLAVNPSLIHPLPLDTPTVIPNTGGVSVTLIEANHCPGSCLFFFEGQQTIDAGDSTFKSPFVGSSRIFRYLHCGDFRASPRHVLHPAVKGKHIDLVYLDTTYLDSKYTFAPQPLVICACAELSRRLVMTEDRDHSRQNSTLHGWIKSPISIVDGGQQILQERILMVVGTYSVGKERIVKAIARALGTKVYCDPRKAAILRCQADKELHDLLTVDPAEASVHILPLGTITSDNLKSYLGRFKGSFSRIVGFRPTGWTYSPPSGDSENASIQSIIARGQLRSFSFTDIQPSQKSSYHVQIFGVPYSEHSSFFELTCFAMTCDWGRIIPTVNVGSATSRARMTKWLKRWESEKKSTQSYVIQPRTADYW